MNVPSFGDILAAFFAAGRPAADPGICLDARDRIEAEPDPDEPVPFALTEEAEAALDAAAVYEAEWADNWDSADSHAYMDRVEAGLEPEAEPW
ncbi:MAG TPA: hypothetical protein VGF32_28955 [Streptosporangiaceae bacterium]|jgi:hypothetical protein